MVTMANSVQAISALKVASTDKIVFESNKVLYKILKSPYNHYSPVLEASEIERIKNENFNYAEAVSDYVPFQLKESSKVRYNLLSDTWTAEDGSTTNFPFGVHQIHEEIVAPIVQNLMNETRIERLKIYNHIKDQKISYLNKWHQDTEDFYGRNRAESADLINLMRASLRDYVAAYNTLTSLKKTEDSMAQSGGSLDSTVVTATVNSAEVFAAFELQSKEFQNVQMDFESYMERLKEDIDVKAGKFEHIDYYDALLRDGNSKDIAVASSEVHKLDERRKPLITVNPLFAKTSEMPPKPNIEDITYDHISLNLPSIAKNTLRELDEDLVSEPTNVEEIESNDNSSNIENVVDDNITNLNSDEETVIANEEEVSEDENSEDNLEADEEESDDEESDDDESDDEESEDEESEDEEREEEEREEGKEKEKKKKKKKNIEQLSDSEIVDIMNEWDIEPMEEFDRDEAISAILEAQENADEDEDEDEDDNKTNN